MGQVHISTANGEQHVYSEEEVVRLWQAGTLGDDSYYWKEGMSDWRPVSEYFATAPTVRAVYVKDPRFLTAFLKVVLWIEVVLCTVGFFLSLAGRVMIDSPNATDTQITIIDALDALTALALFVTMVLGIVLFMMWVYRANKNCHGFGAQGMRFTPGWCVGYFFIPIVNLFRPYQAVKEIWRVSSNPAAWQDENAGSLVAIWWALFLLSNALGQASLRLSIRAESLQALKLAGTVECISDFIDIPAAVVTVLLVSAVYKMQEKWVKGGEAVDPQGK